MLCDSYVNILHAFCVRRKNWRFFSGSGKLNVSIYLISMQSYWPRPSHGCKICCVSSLTNAKESFKFVFLTLNFTISDTFLVNSQNTFLSANFCMV